MYVGDWKDWHDEYDAPNSEIARRMQGVRRHVVDVVDACPPGPITLVSVCGGQGRESIGALVNHPRRFDVRGRLVEIEPENAAVARQMARDTGMTEFEVVTGDASVRDAYGGLDPAELVVISGVFGHIDEDDREELVTFLEEISKPGGAVAWTSYRKDEDQMAVLRERFVRHGFEELSYEPVSDSLLTVSLSRHVGALRPLSDGRIFTFGSSRTRR